MRDGVLGQWMVRTAQIALPWSKVKELLRQFHEESLGGHLGIKKNLHEIGSSSITGSCKGATMRGVATNVTFV
jgi:hypothetical protein